MRMAMTKGKRWWVEITRNVNQKNRYRINEMDPRGKKSDHIDEERGSSFFQFNEQVITLDLLTGLYVDFLYFTGDSTLDHSFHLHKMKTSLETLSFRIRPYLHRTQNNHCISFID